ncbi:MAG: UDP-glucose/GDP-mannose dehydrogenase family protein, partial [Desulfobacterales bacterium]|nr:UDP-glucose/GDP-mannose dehydrogenase family protein [Desulfobacterales bacterium]
MEKDKTKLSKLILGKSTIYEKNLDKFLTLSLLTKRLSFTNNLPEAIKASDLVFVAVGTPPQKDGSVDLTQITSVLQTLAESINAYKVIILKSTVPVGTQKQAKQFLIDQGVSPKHFDIISNPEFLREGTALDDVFYGDRIVVGYDSTKAKAIMQELYKPLEIEIVFTNPETAELIKYAANGFLATKISYINEIANLCDQVGADVEALAYGIGLDHRISPEFLQAGIGYGGSCFPKDTLALAAIGNKFGNEMKIIQSVIEVNQLQKLKPVEILQNRYLQLEGRIISILGLAFKPGTDDIREAPSLYIIQELIKLGAIVKCYDPVVSTEVQKIFPNVLVFR